MKEKLLAAVKMDVRETGMSVCQSRRTEGTSTCDLLSFRLLFTFYHRLGDVR